MLEQVVLDRRRAGRRPRRPWAWRCPRPCRRRPRRRRRAGRCTRARRGRSGCALGEPNNNPDLPASDLTEGRSDPLMWRTMQAPSKAVLITGCSSGIGRATAEHLLARGWTVYATARRPRGLGELEARGAPHARARRHRRGHRWRAAVRAVEDEAGAVGVLVNNAGYSQSGAVESVPMERVRAPVRDQRVRARAHVPARAARACARSARARSSTSRSMGGKLTFPGGGLYHATKHAVEAISDALRFEVARLRRRRRGHRAGADPHRLRRGGGERGRRGHATADGPYARRSTSAVADADRARVRAGPAGAGSAARPRRWRARSSRRSTAERPRARYTVTPSARAMLAQRALLPDGAWDALMRSQFPQPGAS